MLTRVFSKKSLVNLIIKSNYSNISLHKPVLLDEVVYYLVKEPKELNFKVTIIKI